MTGPWNDFNDAEEQTSYDIIPKGTVAPVRMTIKPGGHNDPAQVWTGNYAIRNETTGSIYLNAEFVPPGGSVTLFEADVVTAPEIAGQELIGVNERDAGEDGWIGPFTANPAGTRTTEIGIDVVMPRGLYYANDDGSLGNRTIA